MDSIFIIFIFFKIKNPFLFFFQIREFFI